VEDKVQTKEKGKGKGTSPEELREAEKRRREEAAKIGEGKGRTMGEKARRNQM